MEKQVMDGNKACSYVSYKFSELAGIYPITPASTMAELMDEYSRSGKKNVFGDVVKVVEMQSEAGAIGMVHGALQMGTLATTFTASQGLLLMIPNMYKIAGEMLPCVINVAARTVATHALSIMGDHSDIYAVKQTGFAILASSSVQNVMNLTSVSYMSSLNSSIPFVNFFDGFRTSHEMNKINVIDEDVFKKLIDKKDIDKFRNRALNISNPITRGTNQGDAVFFENSEVRNKYYEAIPDIVNSNMEKINDICGTNYHPFMYYGDKKAKKIIVAMGSVVSTIRETIDYLNKKGKKVGLIEVCLFRPFSMKYFLDCLPKTVKKVAVLDRSKELGASGEALYTDVALVLKDKNIKVIGGRYGLSSKNTTPNDIEAVYNFLDDKNCFNGFTIGITDDVNNTSLVRTNTIFKNSQTQIMIYGYGSDGMVTASKDILKIIGNNTDKYVQGYFEYDSKKSGGVTISHLRFSDNVIESSYYINKPDVIVCTKDSYLKKYNILKNIKNGGTFILNTGKDINSVLSTEDVEIIKSRNVSLYVVDANKISRDNNIPNKISSIMEVILLKCTNLIEFNKVKTDLENQIKINFMKKGKEVVDSNIKALNDAINSTIKVNLDNINSNTKKEKNDGSLFSKLDHLDFDEIKVSDFVNIPDGSFQSATSKLEKRGISDVCPAYDKDKCVMCNLCSLVCPHAVIRPFLLNEKEVNGANEEVKNDLKDSKLDSTLKFTIGVSALDCTGCSLCTRVCPTHAIMMKEVEAKEIKKAEYLFKNVSEKDIMGIDTIKGSQFKKPLFEFHGACAGCGEATYIKLLTQLFGKNMIIANATGCSSIYGASVPSTPYSIPWINSLFEDNAEFGLGIKLADLRMKESIKRIMQENYDKVSNNNKKLIDKYLNNYSRDVSNEVYQKFDFDELKELKSLQKYVQDKSIWIVGGDGWAYDIGFSGIDHVLASNQNVNILVLDTEVYSNTGGQSSKSTRMGAVAKFAAGGKLTNKKDLASIAMTYDNVYVASISLGANYNHTIKTLIEAEKHDGPSIIIAYSPCIAHGIKAGMQSSIEEEKLVVQSGYFPLFRFVPEDNKFYLDSDANFDMYDDIFKKENRYCNTTDNKLLSNNKDLAMDRYNKYKELSK